MEEKESEPENIRSNSNPAFTSIAGILKYQDQYSLNRHTAAALVIARRGYGIMEIVRVRLEPLEKDRLNLAAAIAEKNL